MSINVSWDNEAKTIIHYVFHRGWNWNDYYTAVKTASEMLDTVNHKVGILMDFENASLMPEGAVRHLQRAFSTPRHRNISITVVLGGNTFVQSLVSIGRKLAPQKAQNWELRFVSNANEAQTILNQATSAAPIKKGAE